MVTRGERHNSQFFFFAKHTMLIPPQRAAHLKMFKITINLYRSRSEKLNLMPQWSKTQLCLDAESQLHLSTVKIQLMSFQNPQILRTISSGHDVIYTPALFLV